MEFPERLELVADEPVFETSLLLAGAVDPNYARQQLSRWTKAGKLYQLRRGLYVLAPPFQRVKPHPFLVANRMVPGSYVSLQSALSYHGLIPEYVALTSVGIMRPTRWDTPLLGPTSFDISRTLSSGGMFVWHWAENNGPS